jgi:protein-S-isoprenylcysteine O-methyltransferase Ste14
MGARAFVWLGGALFAASLGLCAWTYLFVLGRGYPPAGWPSILADAALITIFACHHSLFARERMKEMLSRLVPAPLLRSFYVWIASLLLMLVCLLWQPIGGELYAATGLLAIALAIVQLVGLWITSRSVARIDPLELAGIRPAARTQGGLQVTGPYRWVRHPLYLGWVLMVFGAAHMTADRLAFAAITTLYLVVAIPWEERSLRRALGGEYARYMRAVRWRMIPFIY